ncbi:MAG: LytR C-terminal domain-containing protein, partial [Mycobacteriaceae bacterium]|nr:LytR C-terminal domain-containing protein [Mycobacteriaceae bacterium]
ADALVATSTVHYGPGAQRAAQALAHRLSLTATASDSLASETVQLMIGTDFPASDYLSGSGATASVPDTSTAGPTAVTTVAATATGSSTPAPTDLTHMTANGTPCVK